MVARGRRPRGWTSPKATAPRSGRSSPGSPFAEATTDSGGEAQAPGIRPSPYKEPMADLAIGSTLAGYRLDALIARGGGGVGYRATPLGRERSVALKVIARELADREGFRERFLRESRLAASLDHPAVVP